MFEKDDFENIKLAMMRISNSLNDNIEIAKEEVIYYLTSLDCKALNERALDIQQAQDISQLKMKLGSIAALCDLIVKTRYTLC